MLCVTMISQMPVEAMSRMVSSMAKVEMGSSAEHGSSKRTTSGFIASVRAMHRRCCWPPESACADCLSLSLTSSQSAACLSDVSTSSSSSSRDFTRPCFLGANRMFSRMDLRKGVGCWKTMPMDLRSSKRFSLGVLMSRPW